MWPVHVMQRHRDFGDGLGRIPLQVKLTNILYPFQFVKVSLGGAI